MNKLKEKPMLCWGIIAIIEIIILIMTVSFATKDDLWHTQIDASQLIVAPDNGNAALTEQGIGIITPGAEKLEDAQIMSCGPYMVLPKGRYDITIQYETDTDGNRYTMYCGASKNMDALYLTDKDGYFPATENQITCTIRALADLEAFDIQTYYQGIGSFTLKGIEIQETNGDVPATVARVAIMLLILNLAILLRNKIKRICNVENYKYTVGLLMLVFLSGLLLYSNGLYTGHDINFHLLRIEGIKEAILSGQFPCKIQPSFLKGYGYATGVLYPDLFVYIPAIFRLLGFSVIDAYKMFVFLVNAATAIIAFGSFKGIFKDKATAFAGATLYTLAPYRLLDLYYRASVGEYCAMMALPLISYALYTFCTKDEEQKPDWIALAVGYSMVLESHILSMLFVAVISVVIGIIYWKRFFAKDRFVALVKMAAVTILCNLWFIVPFLDYYRLDLNMFEASLKENGVVFSQLFTNQVLGELPAHSYVIGDGIVNEIPMNIGYGILLLTVAFILLVRNQKKYRSMGLISLGFGAVSMVLSLYNFPWDKVQQLPLIGGIVKNIQYPWRFIEIITIAFVICSCIGIEYLSQQMSKRTVILIACILAVLGFTAYTDPYIEKVQANDYITLDAAYLGETNEYLMKGTDKNSLLQNGEQVTVSSELVSVSQYRKKGTKLTLQVNSGSDVEQFIDVPFVMYPGYTAQNMDTGEKLTVAYGDNYTVRVMLPPNTQGQIRIQFSGKWYWKLAEILSVMALLGTISYQVFYDRKKRKGR